MGKIKSLSKKQFDQKHADLEALSFISAGVACYAFSLLDEMGLLEFLSKGKEISMNSVLSYPNPLVLKEALRTLEKNGIIYSDSSFFHFTGLGKALFKHRGSIALIYNGYRNILSNQLCIANDEPSQDWDKVDSLAVSKASTVFGEKVIDAFIIEKLETFSPIGKICDLGCGEGARLLKICKKLNLSGSGIDFSF